MAKSSVDKLTARNSTGVIIKINDERVGRVQSFREDINNNVQVLAELGRQYMAEMKKGVTSYSFTISKFYVRSDVMDDIKLGAVFTLRVTDQTPGDRPRGREVLEYFPRCMVTSLSRDYTIGQASVGENASIVTIGKGVTVPKFKD